MRAILVLLLALILPTSGCKDQRAQQAADNRARLEAATMTLGDAIKALANAEQFLIAQGDAGKPALDLIHQVRAAINGAGKLVGNAHESMPAVAEVPSAKLPPPAHTAAELHANPEMDKPAPEPSGNGGKILALAAAAGLGALALARTVAPLIPGMGPMWAKVIDVGWSIAQHSDAKAADAAAHTVADVAADVVPVARAIIDTPDSDLPPWLRGVMTPGRRSAVAAFLAAAAKHEATS